ncbi:hypothetical protein N2152v2_000747 [Parachlorella kessleri]
METAVQQDDHQDTSVAAAATEPTSPGASSPGSPGKGAFGLVLTLNRVKSFIKEYPDVKSISSEACFAVARATELLLEALAQRASQKMLAEEREELLYNDIATTVATWEALDFLQDVVPKKVPAAVVLEKMKA